LDSRIRKAALALARDYPEQCDRLNGHSLETALQAGADKQQYLRALEEANLACRLDPDQGSNWRALGVAQYRLGLYDKAVVSLTHAVEANMAQSDEGGSIIDLAFLVMARHCNGEVASAQDDFHHLKKLLDDPRWRHQGYGSLAREVDEVLHSQRPTHK
jgi:hypothetical protein